MAGAAAKCCELSVNLNKYLGRVSQLITKCELNEWQKFISYYSPGEHYCNSQPPTSPCWLRVLHLRSHKVLVIAILLITSDIIANLNQTDQTAVIEIWNFNTVVIYRLTD